MSMLIDSQTENSPIGTEWKINFSQVTSKQRVTWMNDLVQKPAKFRENKILKSEHKVVNCIDKGIKNEMLCGSVSVSCSVQWNLCT